MITAGFLRFSINDYSQFWIINKVNEFIQSSFVIKKCERSLWGKMIESF